MAFYKFVPFKFRIDIVADEIEKGRELGITDSFGVGFVAVGKSVQLVKDIIRGLIDRSQPHRNPGRIGQLLTSMPGRYFFFEWAR